MTLEQERRNKRDILECPCQSGLHYQKCCQVAHDGAKIKNAEMLMRSRYSAFVLNLPKYLLNTWHSAHRPESIEHDPNIKWFYLRILNVEEINALDEQFVTFEARFRENGKAHKFKERSRFIEEKGRLVYIDGEFLS